MGGLSVIVMGFLLLLGRLAQPLLARCFEGGSPPCQLIEHLSGGLIEMLEFAQRLAVFDHGPVIWKQDVNSAADWRHLQLDGMEPQLLYRASAADAAVAYESDRLVAPFSVGVVERILQNRGRSAIVFGSREDKGVEFADFLLPALGNLIFRRSIKPRSLLREQRHGVILQIDQSDFEISPAPGDLFDPLCGMAAEAIGSDASDHDGKLRFAQDD